MVMTHVKGHSSRDRPTDESRTELSFGFLLAPKFTLTAFSGFVDMLRLCADQGDQSRQIICKWTILSADMAPVQASCGVEIKPWEKNGNPARFDYIVVVGGLLSAQQSIEPAIFSYLREAAGAGVPLIGLCTGSFILARAGLLDNRRCCVHWFHQREFASEFPTTEIVSDKLFIDEGDRITCAGGTAVIDLAAHVFARRWDTTKAMKASRQLVVDWPRDAEHTQLPFVGEKYDVSDRRLRKALQIMEENLGAIVPVGELAKRCNVSVRQLDRQFRSVLGCSPSAYHRELRLKHATWLLCHTTRSVTEIAFECGFADSSHLSRIFRQVHGTSPAFIRNAVQAKQSLSGLGN